MGALNNISHLGAGIGFRRELRQEIIERKDEIDFLEVISDNFLEKGPARKTLKEICDHFAVIPHGVGLSIGSANGVDDEYLQKICEVSEITGSPYYSEHLCHTQAPGIDLRNLAPLWFSEEVLDCTIRNVQRVQEALGKPLVLENTTYLLNIPDSEISQDDFFRRLVSATGCGVLLDVTNVFINSVNHGDDSIAFMEGLPLENVVQVHLAGGRWDDDVLLDSHTETVQEKSWGLLDALLERTSIKGAILEHDGNYPDDFSVLTNQISRARGLMEQHTQQQASCR